MTKKGKKDTTKKKKERKMITFKKIRLKERKKIDALMNYIQIVLTNIKE